MNAWLARSLSALMCGTLFGLGLAVSGLADPDVVLQFLTFNSNWSPALLFTMAAGILVTVLGYRWVLRRKPVLAERARLPEATAVDRRLLAGAAIFGVGWGLAGFCPGPALVGLSTGLAEPIVFLAAMLVGAYLPIMARQRRAEAQT